MQWLNYCHASVLSNITFFSCIELWDSQGIPVRSTTWPWCFWKAPIFCLVQINLLNKLSFWVFKIMQPFTLCSFWQAVKYEVMPWRLFRRECPELSRRLFSDWAQEPWDCTRQAYQLRNQFKQVWFCQLSVNCARLVCHLLFEVFEGKSVQFHSFKWGSCQATCTRRSWLTPIKVCC